MHLRHAPLQCKQKHTANCKVSCYNACQPTLLFTLTSAAPCAGAENHNARQEGAEDTSVKVSASHGPEGSRCVSSAACTTQRNEQFVHHTLVCLGLQLHVHLHMNITLTCPQLSRRCYCRSLPAVHMCVDYRYSCCGRTWSIDSIVCCSAALCANSAATHLE